MRLRFFISSIVSASALVFTGCPQRQEPDPGQTVVGPNQGAGAGSGIYVPPGELSADDLGQGLSLRDPAFDSAAQGDGNLVEGLLEPVYFGFDESFIAPDQRPALAEAAEYLRGNPRDRLLLEGHCDWRGTSEYNLALGERRAGSVKQYLVQLGIDPNRLEVKSRGDLEATKNASENEAAQDRRVDLIVVEG